MSVCVHSIDRTRKQGGQGIKDTTHARNTTRVCTCACVCVRRRVAFPFASPLPSPLSPLPSLFFLGVSSSGGINTHTHAAFLPSSVSAKPRDVASPSSQSDRRRARTVGDAHTAGSSARRPLPSTRVASAPRSSSKQRSSWAGVHGSGERADGDDDDDDDDDDDAASRCPRRARRAPHPPSRTSGSRTCSGSGMLRPSSPSSPSSWAPGGGGMHIAARCKGEVRWALAAPSRWTVSSESALCRPAQSHSACCTRRRSMGPSVPRSRRKVRPPPPSSWRAKRGAHVRQRRAASATKRDCDGDHPSSSSASGSAPSASRLFTST